MPDELKPRKGALAICGIGLLGLITEDEPREITYTDGNKGISWRGIQLTDATAELFGKSHTVKIGGPWTSKNPRVIGYLDEFTDKLKVEPADTPSLIGDGTFFEVKQ